MSQEKTNDNGRPTPARGRPRSEAVRLAVLRAVIEMVNEVDYGKVSMEGIAARAGVAKQTLYRWWPTKGAIIMEAMLLVGAELPDPDTGNLKTDLTIWCTSAVREAEKRSAPALRGLMAEALLDSEFGQQFRDHFIATRRKSLLLILERAKKRGELGRSTKPEIVVDIIYGTMWYRRLTRHGKLDASFAKSLVDHIHL